jgi:hypothetical protein
MSTVDFLQPSPRFEEVTSENSSPISKEDSLPFNFPVMCDDKQRESLRGRVSPPSRGGEDLSINVVKEKRNRSIQLQDYQQLLHHDESTSTQEALYKMVQGLQRLKSKGLLVDTIRISGQLEKDPSGKYLLDTFEDPSDASVKLLKLNCVFKITAQDESGQEIVLPLNRTIFTNLRADKPENQQKALFVIKAYKGTVQELARESLSEDYQRICGLQNEKTSKLFKKLKGKRYFRISIEGQVGSFRATEVRHGGTAFKVLPKNYFYARGLDQKIVKQAEEELDQLDIHQAVYRSDEWLNHAPVKMKGALSFKKRLRTSPEKAEDICEELTKDIQRKQEEFEHTRRSFEKESFQSLYQDYQILNENLQAPLSALLADYEDKRKAYEQDRENVDCLRKLNESKERLRKERQPIVREFINEWHHLNRFQNQIKKKETAANDLLQIIKEILSQEENRTNLANEEKQLRQVKIEALKVSEQKTESIKEELSRAISENRLTLTLFEDQLKKIISTVDTKPLIEQPEIELVEAEEKEEENSLQQLFKEEVVI